MGSAPWKNAATAPTAAPRTQAGFALSKTFGSHMVLQVPTPVLFGFDTPGAAVNVTLDGGAVLATSIAGADGVWRLTLPPQVYGGPHSLSVASTSGGAAVLSDVFFGEVFLCGGQSVRAMAGRRSHISAAPH